MSDKKAGRVKWFDNAKGFGFISREDGQEVFVHYRSIQGDGYQKLSEGQLVQYTLQEGERGLQAVDVIVGPEPLPTPQPRRIFHRGIRLRERSLLVKVSLSRTDNGHNSFVSRHFAVQIAHSANSILTL